MKLAVGDHDFSSWSLRPWLLIKQAGVPFEEILVPLRQPETKTVILEHSPSGKVPCLIDGETVVWDSLAICEYIAELVPCLWLTNRHVRAEARSISAEMHAGFAPLRKHMDMIVSESRPGEGRMPDVEADIARIVAIWESCRHRFAGAGPFLFSRFSVAEAMFAPVVWRFATYALALPPAAQAWADSMRALPAIHEWKAGALAEKTSRAL